MEKQAIENLTKQIANGAFRVHKELGPGLLESVYLHCMMEELNLHSIRAEQEVYLPVFYRGRQINKDFRLDILVENEIILELKSVEILLPIHVAQIITYLKLADKRIGFLMNFNVVSFRDGIRRYVNNY